MVPDPALTMIRSANILAVACFIFALMAFLLDLLRHERERSEALLHNILPREIASALKNERKSIAALYPETTILFADVVDFTPMSAAMQPEELIEFLDGVFSYFDLLVEAEGLEKIKTIGDCYMVAAGVPIARPDHAEVVASIALDMLEYAEDLDLPGGHQVQLRIGINSGPVVAGVIGRKKFLYDLWGDTVNTASRMETTGEPGRIQITEATYEQVKDAFVCEPRGLIDVKGKGQMAVWNLIAHQTDVMAPNVVEDVPA
jgi:guanylate cyclase